MKENCGSGVLLLETRHMRYFSHLYVGQMRCQCRCSDFSFPENVWQPHIPMPALCCGGYWFCGGSSVGVLQH